MPSASCRCCQANIPVERPRICPECGHVFKGNGWDGIDAHWRTKHERVMPYTVFWESLCSGQKQ
jgi:predicted amidophosphoribosyltransferase